MIYAEAVTAWEESRRSLGEVQPYTAKKSAEKARYFVPFIGSEDVDEISPCDIEQAIVTLKRDRGLSTTTLRAIHLAGTQACDWVIAHGHATTNPFKLVPRPKAAKTRARSLDSAQANQLALFARQRRDECLKRGEVQQSAFCMCVMLALTTGLRRGELFGLEWQDFNGTSLFVQRSLKPDGKHVGAPKTQSGVRRIALGENMANELASYRAWQSSKVPSRKWDDPQPVIAKEDGTRSSMNVFEHWWAKFRADAGFDGLKFHELRHTHATLLISNGVDVKTVQGRLGHSSADITMNVYAHALPRNDAQAANEIDVMLLRVRS